MTRVPVPPQHNHTTRRYPRSRMEAFPGLPLGQFLAEQELRRQIRRARLTLVLACLAILAAILFTV